jgi:hypothetical protein
MDIRSTFGEPPQSVQNNQLQDAERERERNMRVGRRIRVSEERGRRKRERKRVNKIEKSMWQKKMSISVGCPCFNGGKKWSIIRVVPSFQE